MKKKMNIVFKTFFIVFATLMLLNSCSSNEPELPKSPEAKAAYDQSSAGIIKGVLVGSSGVFKFSIMNGNDSVYCKVDFDGKSGTLTSTDFSGWTPGSAINRAKFSGKVGDLDVVVYLSCDSNGANTSVEFTIPGHTVIATAIKETSTSIVKGYEGTYVSNNLKTNEKNDEGTFNLITINGIVKGYHKGLEGGDSFDGTISGNDLTIGKDVLHIDETTISGTVITSESKITVTGKRTL